MLSIEQVIAQFLQASEAGTPLDTDQLIRRHPEFAHELGEFFQIHEQFTPSTQSAPRPEDPTITQDVTLADERLKTRTPRSTRSTLVNHPPKEFGDYEVLQEINRGGMGVVYKARHKQLGRVVALKLILSGELASDEEVQRFLSEAEAAATLTHPGIVPIFELGTVQGLVFYTMAYVDGPNLADVISQGAMDPLEAARVTHKLCAAVEYAHQSGVYHRDLKPSNVLINEFGQPVIIDFGLAKLAHQDNALTVTGQLLGTPAYMAPEHATGRAANVGPASDVYALGAILYCLCAGQPAFSGPTPFDVLLQVMDRRPPAPSKLNKRVTKQLDYVALRALEKDPAERYQTAVELAADLQRIIRGEPLDCPTEGPLQRCQNWWRREPILVAHVVGIGTTMAIVAAAFGFRDEPSPLFPYRMLLLSIWLVASWVLQRWVYRARWRSVSITTWLAVDVTIYTTLITFADPPRSMLLIGYPMMVVASSLFFQHRYVGLTTGLSILGFLLLGWQFPKDDFVRADFSAIFASGLIVICLCMLAMIRRIRGLSIFYEESSA